MQSGQLPAPDRAADVVTMLDHAAYFFPTERARWFDRLYRPGAQPLDLTELPTADETDLARAVAHARESASPSSTSPHPTSPAVRSASPARSAPT